MGKVETPVAKEGLATHWIFQGWTTIGISGAAVGRAAWQNSSPVSHCKPSGLTGVGCYNIFSA